MRRLLGITFLLLQVAAGIHARFVPSRWLGAWAPNDYAVRAACQPSVGLLFECTEMAVLTISLALPIRPFCKLAIDWTNVRDDRPTRAGIENQKHPRKQKHK